MGRARLTPDVVPPGARITVRARRIPGANYPSWYVCWERELTAEGRGYKLVWLTHPKHYNTRDGIPRKARTIAARLAAAVCDRAWRLDALRALAGG